MTTALDRAFSDFEQRANRVVNFKPVIEIKNNAELVKANDKLALIKSVLNEAKTEENKLLEPVRETQKRIKGFFSKYTEKLNVLKSTIDRAVVTYLKEQEAIREKERERLVLAQQKKADQEKQKLERKIEQAKEKGLESTAEALEDLKDSIVPVIPSMPDIKPKIEGMHTMTKWHYEVTNVNKLDRQWLMPDHVKIQKMVNSLKGDTNIEGIRVYSETKTVHRGG